MSKKTPSNILIFRFSALGDVAMLLPVLKAAVTQNPNVKFTIVSRPFFKPLFLNAKNITFYDADLKNKHKGILGLYRLYKELKSNLTIGVVADCHDVLRTKILSLFFKLSFKKIEKIDKGRAEKKALVRENNKVFKQLKSSHERYADVLRKLGLTVNLSAESITDKKDLNEAVLKLTGKKNTKWIGVAPFAQHIHKVYPLELITEVIQYLSNTEKHTIFLFGGGKNETGILNELSSKFNNVVSVAGKISFTDELVLISNLDCMISMDSANAHLAANYGVHTITLWGATHPYAGFYPYNQPKENCILPDLSKYPKLPCSIYGNKTCSGYEDVMRTIKPKDVIDRVIKVVNKPNKN